MHHSFVRESHASEPSHCHSRIGEPPVVCDAEVPVAAQAAEVSTDASAAYLSKMQMLRELGFLSESSAEAEALARSQDTTPAVTRSTPGHTTDEEERCSLSHTRHAAVCLMTREGLL